MTIEELIDKLTKDRMFQREFKTLVARCCKDRDKLKKQGLRDQKAAKAFLTSWEEFYKRYAFDPISLAALSLPKVKYGTEPCREDLKKYTVLTGTQTAELYNLGKTRPQSGTKTKPKTGPAKKR